MPTKASFSITVLFLIVYSVFASIVETSFPSAIITTPYGNIAMQLRPDAAPLTVANFIKIVNEGFYNHGTVNNNGNGTTFYRYEANFVLQGGNMNHASNSTVPLEYNLPNDQWTVGLARDSDPHSGSSEFFINLVNNSAHLDPSNGGGYAVFAEVTDGFDAISQMEKLPVVARDGIHFFKNPKPAILHIEIIHMPLTPDSFIEWVGPINADLANEARKMVLDDNVAPFASLLEFGTAGLRGPMGAGFNRMNDLTVIQAAQGLVLYLLDKFGTAAKEKGIVLGYDHRASGNLNSHRFALLTSAAAFAQGVPVYLYNRLVCTPLVPFGILHTGAVAGVMVTASHNPKEDNGYKVYWDNGAQIIPPHDSGISSLILSNLAPWPTANYAEVSEQFIRSNSLCFADNTDAVIDAYIFTLREKLCRFRSENGLATAPKIAYTAMHGVGYPFVQRIFSEFNLNPPLPVEAQVQPDPTFPTVAFPNPEEGRGALALAVSTADSNGCTLILANDPDADRLAVAEKSDGSWRIFTGNEIGALLASWSLDHYVSKGGSISSAALVTSTVSSKWISRLAATRGCVFSETLTGFKWIGNEMRRLQADGFSPVFAFEEAIGFCCGDSVPDKDGVSASAVLAEMATFLARNGLTLSAFLEQQQSQVGFAASANGYVVVPDPKITLEIFKRLRNDGHYWKLLGDVPIVHVRDLTGTGIDTENLPSLRPTLPTSNGTQMITYKFANDVVATLRTSGTEPKLKFYCEATADTMEEAKQRAKKIAGLILNEMIQPERYELKRPEL